MTLLKQFTGWATASNRTLKQQMFKYLRLYLLLSYLIVMAVILGSFGVAVYIFFSRSVNEQLNQQLLTLAQAAVPSLEAVENKGVNRLRKDFPWRDLFNRNQSLEWFNADGKLLARQGSIFSDLPLKKGSQVIQQAGSVRTLTISVYSSQNEKTLQLKGYIRASESTQQAEALLKKLAWGLGLGGIMALVFSEIGGMWLTQQALEPVEQSFGRLKQFTADASHELRNPLTVINTAVEVMQSHPERTHPADAKKLVAIASATDQLTRLAEDLLFLARTDAATTPSSTDGQIALDKVLQDVITSLQPQAQAKRITFTSNLFVDTLVEGDAAQIHRLFFNLVENAIKYTQTGGKVFLSMTKRQHFVVVSVEDTGIGITPENLPLIFQRFWRSDQARSRKIAGSGLGLPIAQAIALAQGGKITVKSQVGVGTCFQVYLPQA